MKKLPIGIQTFKNLINEGYHYVDKTPFVHDLVTRGKYYFLSRPRRFGKSLFLSTLKSSFSGEKDLFQNLFLENNWEWSVTYPVVHISFGSGVCRSVEDIQVTFDEILYDHTKKYGIRFVKKSRKGRFGELIQLLNEKYNQAVVILIDEYDKPILDNIHDKKTAISIREELKNIYSVIKDSDPYIKFVFITGVSKFSKVSLFSGLNNLNDITLAREYSAICGYTQEDLETVFAERLEGVDLGEVRKWYNGYNWLGEEVYNPFDILLYLDSKEFRNYWFETATPTFLIKLLETGRYYIPDLYSLSAGEEIIGSFDVDDIKAETLLFQTGYLTIKKFQQIGAFRRYDLTYPNLEVESSLNNYILTALVEDHLAKTRNQSAILDALQANDFDKLKTTIHAFFASIPNQWYRKNQIANYEGYYASIVYCYFAALGLDTIPEDPTNHGMIDLVIRFDGRVYIIEFKVVELTGKGNALQQIKAKKYHQKYSEKDIYLIGIEFSSQDRNIVNFEWEKI
jgi:hypothetical protein